MTSATRRRLAVLLVTAAIVAALDHFTKYLVSQNIALGNEIPAGAPVTIAHTENSGAAFGLFPGFQQLYLIVAVVVSGYILITAPRMQGSILRQVVLGGILGGAISNGVDRALRGHVTDLINFHFWPVFNVADMAIVGGMLVAVVTFRSPREQALPPG